MRRATPRERLLANVPGFSLVVLLPVLMNTIAITLQRQLCLNWCHEERRSVVFVTVGLSDSVLVAASFATVSIVSAFLLLIWWRSPRPDVYLLFLGLLLIVPVVGLFMLLSFPASDILPPIVYFVVVLIMHGIAFVFGWAVGAAFWQELKSAWMIQSPDSDAWERRQQHRWLAGWLLFCSVDIVGWKLYGFEPGASASNLFTMWAAGLCILSWIVGGSFLLDHPMFLSTETTSHQEIP